MRSLKSFDASGYERGRPVAWQALWFATSFLMFQQFWCPNRWRSSLLRMFGATVGDRAFIRHDVRIMWPWKLTVGDDCWLGEGLRILNLEQVTIGNDVCLSQEVMLCTGSHDHRRADFPYRNAPICISDGAWIGARATVLPGVNIGRCSVVAAGEFVRSNLEELRMQVNGEFRKLQEPE